MKGKVTGIVRGAVLLLIVCGLFLQVPGFAQEREKGDEKKPERLITMAAEYPGVEVPLGEKVSMDLIFHNGGRSEEDVNVLITSKPENWKTRIKTYRYEVSAIHVASGEDKRLTFEADPGKDLKPGEYRFRIEGKTPDDRFQMAQTIVVKVREKTEGPKEAKGVKLTTSYPVLRGPSDAKFEFSVEVDSQLDKDAVFDLFAQGTEGWEINFKPAYETKYISSLRLKANQSTTVAVEVKPPAAAAAGEFPVNIRVSSEEAKADAGLTVILTGTYTLEVGTPDGLLSMEARQGKPANMSFYVKNTGSAPNNDIKFMSFKPENWKVEFKPERLETLEPGSVKQVEVVITPYEEALVGDYSVNVRVEGEKANKSLEFRVTVKASTAWGWVGIGVIVAVIGGLFGLFRWLGRR